MPGVFVDLSHTLANGMPMYPGLPEPTFGAHLDHDASRGHYEDRAEFFLGTVQMSSNTGTYVDSPFHRFRDAEDLSAVPLEALVGVPGIVVDVDPGARAVALDLPSESLRGRAVLFRSGWSERWGSESYWDPGPYLSAPALGRLIEAPAALVGVDFWNVDDTSDPARPAHTRLLQAGIVIVEHLCNLSVLPADAFRFFAPVLSIAGGASFPVRAFAELD